MYDEANCLLHVSQQKRQRKKHRMAKAEMVNRHAQSQSCQGEAPHLPVINRYTYSRKYTDPGSGKNKKSSRDTRNSPSGEYSSCRAQNIISQKDAYAKGKGLEEKEQLPLDGSAHITETAFPGSFRTFLFSFPDRNR